MACWLSNIGKSLFIMGMTPSKSFSVAENNGQNNYKIWKKYFAIRMAKPVPETLKNYLRAV